MPKANPTRMCISCRIKSPQRLLSRYRFVSGRLEFGAGVGRSFYICDECLKKDEKTLKKILMRYTKGGINEPNLKERLLYGKC